MLKISPCLAAASLEQSRRELARALKILKPKFSIINLDIAELGITARIAVPKDLMGRLEGLNLPHSFKRLAEQREAMSFTALVVVQRLGSDDHLIYRSGWSWIYYRFRYHQLELMEPGDLRSAAYHFAEQLCSTVAAIRDSEAIDRFFREIRGCQTVSGYFKHLSGTDRPPGLPNP